MYRARLWYSCFLAGQSLYRKQYATHLPAVKAEIYAKLKVLEATGQAYGGIGKLRGEYGLGKNYISDLKKQMEDGPEPTLTSIGQGAKGRPTVLTKDKLREMEDVLKDVGYDISLKALAEKISVAESTVQRHFKNDPDWRIVHKRLIPYLSQENKDTRKAFAAQHRGNKYKHCVWIDVDEKWFHAWTGRGTLKLPPGTKAPKQRMKSKRFIPKVMFLSAVTRPRWSDPGGQSKHREIKASGKVYFKRVAEEAIAKRNSKKREKGDVYTKDVNMNSPKYVEMMKELIDIARARFHDHDKIYIQEDNATPHKKSRDDLRRYAAEQVCHDCGPEIEFVFQPPNSPDTNANDLAFFSSLDASMKGQRPYDLALMSLLRLL